MLAKQRTALAQAARGLLPMDERIRGDNDMEAATEVERLGAAGASSLSDCRAFAPRSTALLVRCLPALANLVVRRPRLRSGRTYPQ